MTKEPKDAVVLAARLAKAFPALSAYSAATLAEELCAIERAQRRHAERCCSGEDGGYVKRLSYGGTDRYHVEHDPDAEERAEKRILARLRGWHQELRRLHGPDVPLYYTLERESDPRGPVLLLRLPNETEAEGV